MKRSALAEFYADDGEGSKPKKRSVPMRLLLNAAHLYRLRVREQPLQELLALIGIAGGVALLFAVQVASTSVTGAVKELAHGISGQASLELSARGPDGMEQGIASQADRLPGVRAAAPVLMQKIRIIGPTGSRSLTLVGVDSRIEKIGGPLVRRFNVIRKDLGSLGMFLTADTAATVGVSRGQSLTIESGDRKREVLVAGVISADEIGGLAKSPVVLAPLGQAQRIASMQGRISRVLVAPEPGAEETAGDELAKLAGDRLDARPSDTEVHLLAAALKPDQQSSALFSAIAVVIGMLFAYNAMLLATARRRRLAAYVRMLGADRRTVIATLAFDAIALGLAASIVGVALGEILSRVAFQSVPQFLTSGFPVGAQRVVDLRTVILSLVGGLCATILASAGPAVELFKASPAEALSARSANFLQTKSVRSSAMLWLGIGLIVVTSTVAFLVPMATPVGVAGLIVGLVLVLGPILSFLLSRLSAITRTRGGISFAIAVDELSGNIVRATALAVIAAGSVTAILSIGGARLDLERGVDRLDRNLYASGDLWLAQGGDANTFLTQNFEPADAIRRLKRLPEVHTESIHRGSFLDIGPQRVRVVARPSNDPLPLATNQVLVGNPNQAIKRIQEGGWIAITESVLPHQDPRIGEKVTIPTPTGRRTFRLAASLLNYGWPTGALVMNADDYRDAWASDEASAIAVDLAPGIPLSTGRHAVIEALGPGSALRVQTSSEMVNDRAEVLAQGLARLRQISSLVLAAAILAIVAAMFAAVWQRRSRLSALRAIGMHRSELYRSLFAETSLIVLLGGTAGLLFGLFCQFFASRFTEMTSGYQSPFHPAFAFGAATLAKAVILTVIATAGPAFIVSRLAPASDDTS